MMTDTVSSVKVLPQAEFEDTLLRILECPVCSKYLVSGTVLCKNGHTICSSCKQQLKTCPTCRQDFLSTRNLFLEELAGLIQYPCENYGCRVKLSPAEMDAHGKVCDFRVYKCFLGLFGPCSWKGVRGDLLSHVTERHVASLITLHNGQRMEVLNYNNVDGDSDLCIERLLTCFGEIFRYVYLRKVKAKMVYCLVQYIGKKDKADNYRYKLVLKGKSEKKLSYCSLVHSDTEDPITILESGDCFTASFEQINHLVQYPVFSMYVSMKCLKAKSLNDK